jgi:hypothetical protein
MLVRAVQLVSFPFKDPQQKRDLEKLLNDLYLDLRPEGRVEEMLVERIACIYFQLSRLYRFQGAVASIAIHNEFCATSVEPEGAIEQIRCRENSRKRLVDVFDRCNQALISDDSISAELMKELYACVFSLERRYRLQAVYEEMNKVASPAEDSKHKKIRITQLKAEFLGELSIGSRESLESLQDIQRWTDEMARARFEQHFLPEEGVLRKVARYQSMLDREFHRSLDRLERLQQRRRANGFRGSEPLDDPLPVAGKILT